MRGTERARHVPFAPQAGRRCRQADEGARRRRVWQKRAANLRHPRPPSLGSMDGADRGQPGSSGQARGRRRAG
ncbi:hypothetical protein CO652_08885 [Rhizobium sp. H4]|nr:hypothetical protein CO652_08885 [Rhizobium sp. H4]